MSIFTYGKKYTLKSLKTTLHQTHVMEYQEGRDIHISRKELI